MVIYNSEIMLVISCKDVSPYRLSRPPWYFVQHCFVLKLCWLKIKACGAFLTFFFCWCSYWSSRWTCVLIAIYSLYPCNSGGAVSVLCLVMMLVLLFFYLLWKLHLGLWSHLKMTSPTAIPSGFVDGQPWSTCSDRLPRCSLSRVVTYFFCCHSVWHVDALLLHWWVYMYLVFLHLWLSYCCVWIGSLQSVVLILACVVFLCCTDEFIIVFFAAFVIGMQHLS